jgi:hypothetical protein
MSGKKTITLRAWPDPTFPKISPSQDKAAVGLLILREPVEKKQKNEIPLINHQRQVQCHPVLEANQAIQERFVTDHCGFVDCGVSSFRRGEYY